jgi:hypothetical protein
MGKPRKHKRKGPKSTRAGCLLCKPHKRQGVNDPVIQERKLAPLSKWEMEYAGEMARAREEVQNEVLSALAVSGWLLGI